MKKLMVIFFISYALAAPVGDPVSYGKVYIKNNSEWNIKVMADIKDEWDNVTPSEWLIAKDGAEVLGNLFWISNIRFKVDVDDIGTLPEWLHRSHSIEIQDLQQQKDLIIYIEKSRFGDRWQVDQQYVSGVNFVYGGPTGAQLSIEAR